MVYGKKFLPKNNIVKETPIQLESISVVYNEYLNRLSLLENCTNSEERTILEAQVEVLYEVSFEDIKNAFHNIKEKIKEAWDKFVAWVKRIWNKIFHNEKVVDAKVKATEEIMNKAAQHEAQKEKSSPTTTSSSTSSTSNTNSDSSSSSEPIINSDNKLNNKENDPFINNLNNIIDNVRNSSNAAKEENEEIKQDLGGNGGLSKEENNEKPQTVEQKGEGEKYTQFANYFKMISYSWKVKAENRESGFAVGNISKYSNIYPDKFNKIGDKILDFVTTIKDRMIKVSNVADSKYNSEENEKAKKALDVFLYDSEISNITNRDIEWLSDIKLVQDASTVEAENAIKKVDFSKISNIFINFNSYSKEIIKNAENDKRIFDEVYNNINKNIDKINKAFESLDEVERFVQRNITKQSEVINKTEKNDDVLDWLKACMHVIKSINKFKNSLQLYNKNYPLVGKSCITNLKNEIANQRANMVMAYYKLGKNN